MLCRLSLFCLQISANDGLPNHLCAECNAKLVSFNKFRALCSERDTHFRTRFEIPVKVEATDATAFDAFELSMRMNNAEVDTELLDGDAEIEDEDMGLAEEGENVEVMMLEQPDEDDDETRLSEDNSLVDEHSEEEKVTEEGDDDATMEKETVVDEKAEYQCDICKQRFKEPRMHIEHMRLHEGFSRVSTTRTIYKAFYM